MSLMKEQLTRNTAYIMWLLERLVISESNESWSSPGSNAGAKQCIQAIHKMLLATPNQTTKLWLCLYLQEK